MNITYVITNIFTFLCRLFPSVLLYVDFSLSFDFDLLSLYFFLLGSSRKSNRQSYYSVFARRINLFFIRLMFSLMYSCIILIYHSANFLVPDPVF